MMNQEIKERLKDVKSILVSQPKPKSENSPYYTLAERFGIKVDFRPFIEVEACDLKEFRQQKINILDHSAVIFTSRNAVDHFFNLCKELKVDVPAESTGLVKSTSIYKAPVVSTVSPYSTIPFPYF